jgi:ribonuclease BN (tRNA processing enzyme)
MNPVRVTFLGTGDAFCAEGRRQASYLIRGGESAILLDCGMTTLGALKQCGIDPASIDAVVLSHFHGDHFGGLPSLLLQFKFLQPRKTPLIVAGPPGVEERVAQLCAAMYPDALRAVPFSVGYLELQPRQRAAIGTAEIYAFSVPHTRFQISLGRVIVLDGRKILYSGDAGWNEDLAVCSQGADLFLCECSYYDTRSENHLDYPRLLQLRESIGAKRIILIHIGEEVLAHRAEVGIELAYDGMEVTL